jgi:SAM-dependent methyltransferase
VDSVNDAGERERAFWDQHVPPLARLLRAYERGPGGNTRALLDAVEPTAGARVLDFACGAGITSTFLAQRGARVTGLDISPTSIARARVLAEHLGLTIEFVIGELTPTTFPPHSFDAIVGRYALHHVDLRVIAPIFNEILVPGGSGVFLETMGLNPLLNFSRRLAGRWGVASYGSDDERPIERSDLRILERNLGAVQLHVGKMQFLRIFDRNVLRFRHRRASALLGRLDDGMARLGLGVLSYNQIVKVVKPAATH